MTENSTAAASASDAAPPDESDPRTYADAINEVEDILASLESSAIDVDHLAEQVKRAGFLLQICRDRLARVQGDVGELVESIGDLQQTERPEQAGSDADA